MRRVKFQFDERSMMTREEAERRGLDCKEWDLIKSLCKSTASQEPAEEQSPLPHVQSQGTSHWDGNAWET